MKIITKRVEELKQGDIIQYDDIRRIVLSTSHTTGAAVCTVRVVDTTFCDKITDAVLLLDTAIAVEDFQRIPSDDLEVLVEAARDLLSMDNSGEAGNLPDDAGHKRLTELVDRYAPLPPPTAEDLAHHVRELLCANSSEVTARAKAMLRRRDGK